MEKPMKEEAAAVTSVFWDIKRCPVPLAAEPAQRIKATLVLSPSPSLVYYQKSLMTPCERSPPLESFLITSPRSFIVCETNYLHVANAICEWAERYPPPANLMVISDNKNPPAPLVFFSEDGYNIIEPFPFAELEGVLEEDKCSATGESASWVCSICEYLPGQGFEKFINHLSSQKHARNVIKRTDLLY
ncbi:hypothetical protein ARALYDRAFT_890677 [Arabidopsis lyrata subsp. lyrata]|uniref:NYN domain-containing protein n=1 Tax=Arabidopsis lyrata subsp. lyrata TaxID=81972 RepID=D7KGH2_ARALL|nr:hypothetical protein ARALYDRAFT_890677 [Arabidopsis lyrata subsp. lyrata]